MKVLKYIFTPRFNTVDFILGSMITFQFYLGNIAWWEFILYILVMAGISVVMENKIKEEDK